MPNIYIDTETYSEVPINVGTYAYAAAARIELFGYKFAGESQAHVWEPDIEPMPAALAEAIADPETIFHAHNAQFDRVMMDAAGMHVPIRRWRCTMACAQSLGLPGSLSTLGNILGLPPDKAKDQHARNLVLKFSKPAPVGRSVHRYDRTTDPEDWAAYIEYCRQDVVALEALDQRLPKWNYRGAELESWFLDQEMNDYGVLIDMAFVTAAQRAVANASKRLSEKLERYTAGLLPSVLQRAKVLDYVNYVFGGYTVPDLRGSTLDALLSNDELPQELRDVIYLRTKAAKTSTAKYKRIARAVNSDNRLRGMLRWCGASRTGRFSGQVVQLQNLPRPTYKHHVIEQCIEATKGGFAHVLFGDDTLDVLASALRGVIIAPPRHKLVVSDLSNIEGRVLAWLAGEHWKLRAFAEFDAGRGHDLYATAYARSFNVSPESVMDNKAHGDGTQRQVGKVMELALGYEGGVGAFATFAAAYGLDLSDLARRALPTASADLVEQAEEAYAWAVEKGRTCGMSRDVYVTCDTLKRMWRAAHPAITAFWKDTAAAFRSALLCPGQQFTAGAHVTMWYKKPWLLVKLPSGRFITYLHPRIEDDNGLSYRGVDQFTRQWSRIKTYSGKICENLTQAVARDIIVAAMPRAKAAGYVPPLSAHDELITEAPDTPEYSAAKLSAILADPPPWANGLPLAAAGFEAYRYRKD